MIMLAKRTSNAIKIHCISYSNPSKYNSKILAITHYKTSEYIVQYIYSGLRLLFAIRSHRSQAPYCVFRIKIKEIIFFKKILIS